MKALLQTIEISAVNKLFPYINVFITFKKISNSDIVLKKNQIQLFRELIFPYTVKTKILTFRPEKYIKA
jgi:hypothetical protein